MSARQTVEDFLGAWSVSGEALREAYRTFFTENTVWENVGMSKTVGADAGIALLDQFEQGLGMATIRVDMLSIATDGATVLTERIDHVIGTDGTVKISVRVMGAFEIRNGRIVNWRDYFDTIPFTGGS